MKQHWTRAERQLIALSAVFSTFLTAVPGASAMHIMEGHLPPLFCVVWGVVCLPFLVAGFIGIRHTVHNQRKALILLAMSGAFIFVISSLKIPAPTGSCSHMTGTGLAAILFGPFQASVLSLIVLLFQALLLGHGGITTLGANAFSMGIAGPLIAWGIYILGKKLKLNRKAVIFSAALLGDLLTYCVTSVQLALAHPGEHMLVSLGKFLMVFAPTQLPLAIIEGILTVVVIIGMESYAKNELKAIGYFSENT